MAMTLYQTNIYSNDGSVLLWQGEISKSVTITITSTGTTFYASDTFSGQWLYAGTGTFKGLSTSANDTSATYAVGSTFTTGTSTLNLYIVVEGENSGGDSGSVENIPAHLDIIYSGEIIASVDVDDTITKTLLCAGKLMDSDVSISVKAGTANIVADIASLIGGVESLEIIE